MDGFGTTNVILGILAAMSVIQTIVVLALAYGALRAYQSTSRLLESKLSPSLVRIEGLLANLEKTAAVVRTRTEDLDQALGSARDAAARVGTVVWPRATVVASVAEGVLGAVRRWRTGRNRGGRAVVAREAAHENVKVIVG
jgi:hypothetical protein